MSNSLKTIFFYEYKLFSRNRFQILTLIVVLLVGMYSIYCGKTEIDSQRKIIKQLTAIEKEEFSAYMASFSHSQDSINFQANEIAYDPAYAWYAHGYHAVLYPHDYSCLAIGQRDLFRYYYRLTGMSLHYQLFENEIANPLNLMIGNLDLSFVIVYLLPLLIIALSYNVYSSEVENNTLPLLHIQNISIIKITMVRLLFYWVLVTTLALLLSLIGLATAGDIFHENNVAHACLWILATVIYCSFWFALVFFIVTFRKNSALTAITLLSSWFLLLIIIPVLLNMIITFAYPISSTTLAGFTRRTAIENENNPAELRAVIMDFLEYEPALKQAEALIENNMLNKAYAAFTSLKDKNNQIYFDNYARQIEKRIQAIDRFSWLNVAANTHDVFTEIAQTNLTVFLSFQDELGHFHQKIKQLYFPKLFYDKNLTLEDYKALPVFYMNQTIPWYSVIKKLTYILIAQVILFVVGFFIMKN